MPPITISDRWHCFLSSLLIFGSYRVRSTIIVPFWKKSSTLTCLNNYHPIVLTPIVMKGFERIVITRAPKKHPPTPLMLCLEAPPLPLIYRTIVKTTAFPAWPVWVGTCQLVPSPINLKSTQFTLCTWNKVWTCLKPLIMIIAFFSSHSLVVKQIL